MKPSELIDKLNLRQVLTGHTWHVQAACASRGEGIYEAMESLSTMVKDHRRKQRNY
jgi:ADP-ribosylation factor family